MKMKIGEVAVAEDSDFQELKRLCIDNEGWRQDYNKNGVTVWTKKNDLSDFKVVKIKAVFKDITIRVVYDVLHDPDYRRIWDTNMLDSFEICALNPCNDIGYYALKMPKPLKNRDFVTQRSWLDLDSECFILNHSVNHRSTPPRKGLIRGISYMTGYYMTTSDGRKSTDPGCTLTYVTQADPKGKLPVWAVNKASQLLAPKTMARLHKACRDYTAWKDQNNPAHKPWLHPEQMTIARVNSADILSMNDTGGLAQGQEVEEDGDGEIAEENVKADDVDIS